MDDQIEIGRLDQISGTLEKISKYWKARPNLRLGQILTHAWVIHPSYTKNPEPEIRDIFYTPDSVLIEGIDLLQKNESKDQRLTEK